MDLLKPSYATGYAKNASQSAHPNLWDGLVGAWMPSLGVTGETLRDVSGNGNHGTLTNMDAASDWVATSKGLALDFDGLPRYVQIDNVSSSIDEGKPITVTSQFNARSWDYNKGIFAAWGSQGAGAGNQWALVSWGSDNILFATRNSLNQQTNLFAGGFLAGEIYTVTAVRSLSHAAIYVNGVLKSSANVSGELLSGSGYTSIGNYAGANYFNGIVGNSSIYNRALSPTEIKQLYVDSLAPFRKKRRVSVAVPAAVAPSATYHPLRSLAHPLEQ